MINAENATRTAIGFFLIMLTGAILSSFLGGAFATMIAWISPDFVAGLFASEAKQNLTRYSFVVGMLWGFFIGVGVSGFACSLAVLLKILKIRLDYQKEHSKN